MVAGNGNFVLLVIKEKLVKSEVMHDQRLV